METETYTIEEVIAALNSVGYVDEYVINYIVPRVAYESRVNGIPFTQDAKDPTSDSWGIYQANINTEMAAIYQVMKEEGVELPGITEAQRKQLETNVVPDLNNNQKIDPNEEERKFTKKQKVAVRDFLKNADLKTQTKIFKAMYDIKSKELKTDNVETVINGLYTLTDNKFKNSKKHPEANEFKEKMEKEIVIFNNRKIEIDNKLKRDAKLFREVERKSMEPEKEVKLIPGGRAPFPGTEIDVELNKSLTNIFAGMSNAKAESMKKNEMGPI